VIFLLSHNYEAISVFINKILYFSSLAQIYTDSLIQIIKLERYYEITVSCHKFVKFLKAA